MMLVLCTQCLGMISPTVHGTDCPCRVSGSKVGLGGLRIWGKSVVVVVPDEQLSQMARWVQPPRGKAAPVAHLDCILAPRAEYHRVPYPFPY